MFLDKVYFNKIDHLAIAVLDLESAITYYTKNMGFELDTIRDTQGKYSGMRSAVLFSGDFSIVLLTSLTEGSQIDRYIKQYGPGLQHIAFEVDNLHNTFESMKSVGMEFSTTIIEAPGIRQLFSKRDHNTGMMHEFIERTNQSNFDEKNINQLFEQLESSGEY